MVFIQAILYTMNMLSGYEYVYSEGAVRIASKMNALKCRTLTTKMLH